MTAPHRRSKFDRGQMALGSNDGRPAFASSAPTAAAPAVSTLLMTKGGDLFTIKSDKTDLTRLTNRGDILNAEWSPDKSKIAFTAEVNGNIDVYLMSSTGSDTRRLTSGPARDEDVTWSPDGRTLLFTSSPTARPTSSR